MFRIRPNKANCWMFRVEIKLCSINIQWKKSFIGFSGLIKIAISDRKKKKQHPKGQLTQNVLWLLPHYYRNSMAIKSHWATSSTPFYHSFGCFILFMNNNYIFLPLLAVLIRLRTIKTRIDMYWMRHLLNISFQVYSVEADQIKGGYGTRYTKYDGRTRIVFAGFCIRCIK